MEWSVKGLDRESGLEREIRVFADNADAATARAAALGVVSYAVSPAATAKPPPIAAPMPSCGNCGATIGRSDPRHEYAGEVVCDACSKKLSPQPSESVAVPDAADEIAQELRDRPLEHELPMDAWRRMNAGRMGRRSCPHCGSTCAPVRKSKGSMTVAILLLLLWIVPGVLYMVFYSGHIMVCPACRAKLADVA